MPSRTCRIETLSFLRGWKRRITTYRCAYLALRSPAAFLQNEIARLRDANRSCRRPAPNSRNEGHALVQTRRSKPRGRRRRRAGKKPPPLGEFRQVDPSRVKVRPEMALSKTTPNASLDGCGRAVTDGPTKSGTRGTAGYSPDVSRQFLFDHISVPRCLCLPAHPPGTAIPVQKKRNEGSAHSTSPLGPRLYGMSASPELFSTSGAYTIIGTRWTTRLNLPLAVWLRVRARWKRSGIPPIVSWIWAILYRRNSGCSS
ncbi:hypothetical protein MOQ_000822 [Trypanosoma cruzi marinkellei]|uniref:Uncharacterized protein n=1 Tax=Trypanosoma cruzi marinkellei TaxID=85056 RepID=K2NVE8_TRYCR|nr:hypothetical protein MOQ_000822 [Trypanosoma cruzi marinkellei]